MSSKGKGREVSTTSFLSLKADLAEKRRLAAGDGKVGASEAMGAWKKQEKALAKHLRPSPGVLARAKKSGESSHTTTSQWASTPSAELERERERIAALQRKAEIYDKLKKGLHGGLSDEQRVKAVGLVDWERKVAEEDDSSSDDSGSSDEAGPSTLADDPVIDYIDDFGRTRSARRSEIPVHLLPAADSDRDEPVQEALVTYGRQTSFPVFQADPAMIEQRRAEIAAKHTSGPEHFDGGHEIRNRGAGFFQFSKDEASRQQQMAMLKAEREQTQKARADRSDETPQRATAQSTAQDPFALVEAQHAPAPRSVIAPAPTLSATQKRLAERRAEVEAKRRKMLGDDEAALLKRQHEEQRVDSFLDEIAKQARAEP